MRTKNADQLIIGDTFIDPQTSGMRPVTVVGLCFTNWMGYIHPAGQYVRADLEDPVEGRRTATYLRHTSLDMCG